MGGMFGQLVLQHGVWQPLVGIHYQLIILQACRRSGETLFVDYYYQTLPQVKHWESGHFYHHIPVFANISGYGAAVQGPPLQYCMILWQR